MSNMPQKRNQTSFTSANQPVGRVGQVIPQGIPAPLTRTGGRPKGRRNRRTEAQEALERMGYNPSEIQVALVQGMIEMLKNGTWDDGKVMTPSQRINLTTAIANINEKLMSYQSSKAAPEVEEYFTEEQIPGLTEEIANQPLSGKELLEARKIMATREDLSKRFG